MHVAEEIALARCAR